MIKLRHKSDSELLSALDEYGPLTQLELAHKLGYFWESGIGRRLRRLTEKGLVHREKVERTYIYSINKSKEIDQK